MQYKKTILIVEDDPCTTDLLTGILTANDYKVIASGTGKGALSLWYSHNPDLVLLDLGLPDIDGMDVLKEIRQQSNIPVIVVSSRQNEDDKVEALDKGAMDYVTKPFGSSELLARIRNIIRWFERLTSGSRDDADSFCIAGFRIDYKAYRVYIDGRAVHLTPNEYKIVELLSKSSGKVLTHEQIINQVWGPNNCDSQVLRVNMANIRRKIERNPSEPKLILTELGIGYRFGDNLII